MHTCGLTESRERFSRRVWIAPTSGEPHTQVLESPPHLPRSLSRYIIDRSDATAETLVAPQVRVMNDGNAVRSKRTTQFFYVGSQNILSNMHQRVKAKNEVDALVIDHLKRLSIVLVEPRLVDGGEPRVTGFNAPRRQVDADQLFAELEQVFCPTSHARSDFKDRRGGKKAMDARENGSVPLRVRRAPG